MHSYLYADLDFNAAKLRATEVEAGQDYRPLAPTLTSVVGLSLRNVGSWSANEDNSIVAKGYFINNL